MQTTPNFGLSCVPFLDVLMVPKLTLPVDL